MSRIVFVNRYYAPDHSATSQILTDLATHLAGVGRDVHIIAGNETYAGDLLPPTARLDGVHVHRAPSGGLGRAGLARRAGDYLVLYAAMYRLARRILRPGDILVAKTDPPLLSIAMAVAARRSGASLVNWLQDLYPEVAGALGVPLVAGFAGRPLRAWRDRSLKAAAQNVAIGELMRERLIRRGIHPGQVAVIANWVDDVEIAPHHVADNRLRAAWGLEDKFVVAYSGNLGRAHEYQTLLDAAGLLQQRTDLAFLFIGGGHHVEELQSAAAARGLERLFHFRPYQPRAELSASLGAADAHWLSLRTDLEGLIVPSKFYGIAAAGRPLISVASPDGEVGRLVRQHACGFTVSPGDPRALADAIAALAAAPALRAAMGRRARAMLDENYSKAAALARWQALLEAVSPPYS